MSLKNLTRLLMVVVVMIGSEPADAEKREVKLRSADITVVAPEDTSRGDFYVVRIDVPPVAENKELLKAILEFTMDVSAISINDYVNDTPVFEVYASTADFDGRLNTEAFRRPSSMRRNVRDGENRLVKIDVTEVVKAFLAEPSSNHGLIAGSLTGVRDGVFVIKPSGGTYAKITYYYDYVIR